MQEWDRCSQSLYYFLKKYGKIKDKNKGIIPWAPWEHLVYLIDCLSKYRFIIILKAKQIGITWLMAAANLHTAMFQQGANILSLSKGEEEAWESLDYSKFIHDQLPGFLRLPYGKEQRSFLTFTDMHSTIRALPSTEDAGVGFGGATRVVMDEFEYHRYDNKNYAEIYPAVERGGQFVILSTADYERADTKFKELYRQAQKGDSRFFKIFFPYNVLPERTKQWYDTLDMPLRQKECRFPLSENDALQTVSIFRYYDQVALDDMFYQVMPPVHTTEINTRDGVIQVFKPKVVGEQYLVYTDPSDGVEDPFHTVVMNKLGEGVCEGTGKLKAEECALVHHELVTWYNNAYNSYEVSATAGGTFGATLNQLKTPNQAPRRKIEGNIVPERFGQYMSPQFKKRILEDLEPVIRRREIVSHYRETIEQLKALTKFEGEDIPRVPKGLHDDAIMAWAGAWWLKKYLITGSGIIYTAVRKWGGAR